MFTINLRKKIKNLDGEEIKNLEMGKTLASALVRDAGLNNMAVKYYDWAMKLHKGESFVMDKSDREHLLEFVKNNSIINTLAKVQIMEEIKKAKDETERR